MALPALPKPDDAETDDDIRDGGVVPGVMTGLMGCERVREAGDCAGTASDDKSGIGAFDDWVDSD